MSYSVFDVFRIGIGPSSSHTVGPMTAVSLFLKLVQPQSSIVTRVRVDLFGSLALTGVGHGTDGAVLLGLLGEVPETVDPILVQEKVDKIRHEQSLLLAGQQVIHFDCATDLLFHKHTSLPQHPNGMRLTALDNNGHMILSRDYFSIGGGAVMDSDQIALHQTSKSTFEGLHVDLKTDIDDPFTSASDLLERCTNHDCTIADMVLKQESRFRDEALTRQKMRQIWAVMQRSVERGLTTDGMLPGGLHLNRRAPIIYKQAGHGANNKLPHDFVLMDLLSAFAMAVNEENAAGGRVVTAPTNGSAGVIPAVLSYYTRYVEGANEEGVLNFLLTAAGIGMLYKRNASISAAEMGCQGEIGVSASMAAAGLVAVLGGTNLQIENAAEIAMEHFLGMTCDPLNGLVQVPCIERNSMGAIKAVNAARMALMGDGRHLVSLDEVIETMRQTGIDMQSKYKETSLGGLAVNVVFC